MSIIKKEARALSKLNRLTDYLSVAQIFLRDNFFLEKPLSKNNIKKRLLGHWGTCPGISYVYGQTNYQIIKNKEKDFLYIIGPGHGFPAYQSNIFIDGSLSHYFPNKIPYTKKGLEEIIENFSTPFGYSSHLSPEAPGVLLEGGELGYSLSVSAGAVLDNPNLITICLVGDGEAETGPLASSWNINKLISPKTDGAVLPILHLNGYKISGPTIFGRMKDSEIKKHFQSLSYKVYFIDASLKKDIQIKGIEIFNKAIDRIKKIQIRARKGQRVLKPEWPIIILKTPKGMNGIKEFNNKKIEGNHFSHQVVFDKLSKDDNQVKALEKWLKSYKINDLIKFDEKDNIILDVEIKEMLPTLKRCLGYGKYVHGGEHNIKLPEISRFFAKQKIGQTQSPEKTENSMFLAGKYLSEIIKNNDNLRIFSPDETYSNRLSELFKNTKRVWQLPIKSYDLDMAPEGKVVEILSEHLLFGMLWGYSLTGRFGYFVTYESFAQTIASMADQYVKFLKKSQNVNFRKNNPSLNVILSSLLERQDHNGFSHQNPSFISNNLDINADLINIYFPVDKNMMLHTLKQTMKSRNKLNIIVAGKKITRTWLTDKEAEKLAEDKVMIFNFISDKEDPDLVVATAGDYVTEESIIGVKLFKKKFPNLKIRFVNFFKLDILSETNPKFSNKEILNKFLTTDKGIVFNYHGYPATIKKLLFSCHLSKRIIINGYEEEGCTTSPFDMKARNGLSRFHLIKDLTNLAFLQKLISEKELNSTIQEMDSLLVEEKEYIKKYKIDPDWITEWNLEK